MRTNVNIADDAREFAQVYAHANGITLGDAITELIRKGQKLENRQEEQIQFERDASGFPMLPQRGRVLTTEMVREAEFEETL